MDNLSEDECTAAACWPRACRGMHLEPVCRRSRAIVAQSSLGDRHARCDCVILFSCICFGRDHLPLTRHLHHAIYSLSSSDWGGDALAAAPELRSQSFWCHCYADAHVSHGCTWTVSHAPTQLCTSNLCHRLRIECCPNRVYCSAAAADAFSLSTILRKVARAFGGVAWPYGVCEPHHVE